MDREAFPGKRDEWFYRVLRRIHKQKKPRNYGDLYRFADQEGLVRAQIWNLEKHADALGRALARQAKSFGFDLRPYCAYCDNISMRWEDGAYVCLFHFHRPKADVSTVRELAHRMQPKTYSELFSEAERIGILPPGYLPPPDKRDARMSAIREIVAYATRIGKPIPVYCRYCDNEATRVRGRYHYCSDHYATAWRRGFEGSNLPKKIERMVAAGKVDEAAEALACGIGHQLEAELKNEIRQVEAEMMEILKRRAEYYEKGMDLLLTPNPPYRFEVDAPRYHQLCYRWNRLYQQLSDQLRNDRDNPFMDPNFLKKVLSDDLTAILNATAPRIQTPDSFLRPPEPVPEPSAEEEGAPTEAEAGGSGPECPNPPTPSGDAQTTPEDSLHTSNRPSDETPGTQC